MKCRLVVLLVAQMLLMLVEESHQSSPNSCKGRCGSPQNYYECRCDSSCKYTTYGCCWDYSRTCVEKRGCSSPKFPHGTLLPNKSWYSDGDSIKFSCLPGFEINASPLQTCSQGKWSYIPSCRVGVFPLCNPPLFQKGLSYTPRQITYLLGSKITYKCFKGYRISGTAVRKCTLNGWTKLPVCIRIRCAHLGDLPYGSFLPRKRTKWYARDLVTYYCGTGYVLKGYSKLTCLSSGNWNYGKPHCSPVKCSHRGAPAHGSYEPAEQTSWNYNQEVTFSCAAGYELVGSNYSYCQSDGSWSHPLPQCVRIECVHRNAPIHGSASPDDKTTWYVNDIVNYACDDYYTLNGAETASCQENGEWSNEIPTCIYKTCLGRCSEEVDFDLPCQCISNCDDHLFPCCPDAHICPIHDVPNCPRPITEPNSFYVGTDPPHREGSVIWYRCFPNFLLKGASEATCRSGQWNIEPPVCEPKPNYSSCAGRCGDNKAGPYTCDCHAGCKLSYAYGDPCCQDYGKQCNHH